MVELMFKLKLFEFEKSIDGCKKVVALGPDGAGPAILIMNSIL